MVDAYERELLLRNPLLQRVLRALEQGAPSVEAAAQAELEALISRAPPSDALLLSIERALEQALGQLPPAATKKLFAGALDVKELGDYFSLTVAALQRVARESDEGRALGLEHLWSWFWARELVAYRRFVQSGRRDYDLLDQRPSFWRPGLASKPFWSLDELDPAFRGLEARAEEIRRELFALRDEAAWLPYQGVRGERDAPLQDAASTWNAYFFYHPFKGRFAAHHARCPVTSEVLESLPGLCRRELVLFSALTPGAVIPAHQGPFNGRLRVHLALTGSEGCYLRVGTQIREWTDGKVLVFDDSFEHQVCHAGPHTRIVLMLNVLQPGVPADGPLERAVTAPVPDAGLTDDERAAADALSRAGWWR